MGQKVNPISLRLEQTNRHFDSCWFNDYNYTNLLNRDLKIQSYINLILKQIKYSSARFFIQNLPNKIKINIFFINPKNLRKSRAKGFQLRESSFNVKRKGGTRKKMEKNRNTQLELARKNCFLKNYKKQTINKAKLLNYLLVNSTNTASVVCFSEKKISYTKNKINLFLRYLLLKNFSLKFAVRFSKPHLDYQQKQDSLNFLNTTSLDWPLAVAGRATGKLQPSSFFQAKQIQYFLFSNLLKFKFLNNNNKLSLTTHFIKKKIYDHKNALQENISKSHLKFSSVSKQKYWENQHEKLEVSTFLPLAKVKKKQTSFYLDTLTQPNKKSLISEYGNAFSVKEKQKINTTKLDLFNLLCCSNHNSNSIFLNLMINNSLKNNYLFSSLVNNESLKKTHNNYNKKFQNFNNLTTSTFVAFQNTKKQGFLVDDLAPKGQGYQPKVDYQEINYSSNQSLEKMCKANEKKVLVLWNSSYKKHLESQLSNFFLSDVVLSFFKLSNEKQSAIFLAEEIVYYLEKRVSFLKIKNQILREINKNSFLKGLRITCSGRVGGRSKKAQRSKVQIIKYGQTSLHVFSSKIDFASKHAHTAFGLLGIKVWICYN